MVWIQGQTAVLLEQGRGEMAVMTAVTPVLLHSVLLIRGLNAVLLIEGRDEMEVMSADTAVLL